MFRTTAPRAFDRLRASALTLLVVAACFVAPATASTAAALIAEHGWIRETPPNRDVAAGYVTLRNPGDAGVVIVGATSPEARVEIHTMEMRDGMMRMRPLPRLEIAAGATAELAPGGTHLMLFDVDATRAGTRIALELVGEDGSTLPLDLPVRRTAPQGD